MEKFHTLFFRVLTSNSTPLQYDYFLFDNKGKRIRGKSHINRTIQYRFHRGDWFKSHVSISRPFRRYILNPSQLAHPSFPALCVI